MRIIVSLLIICLVSSASSATAKKQFDLDGIWEAVHTGEHIRIRGHNSFNMQGGKHGELFSDNEVARELAMIGRGWRDDVLVSASNDMMVGKNIAADIVVAWIKITKKKNISPISADGEWEAFNGHRYQIRNGELYEMAGKRIGGFTVRDKNARRVLLTGPDWRDDLIISQSGDMMAGKNSAAKFVVWWRKVDELQPLAPKVAVVPQRPNNPAPPQNIAQPNAQQENEEPLEPFSLDDDPVEEEANLPPPTDPEGILDRGGPAGGSTADSKGKKRKARIPRDAVKWNGHHYKAYDEGVPHSVAKKRCEMMGGHLARIENTAENQFITRLSVKFPNHTGMWIDGSDVAREGVWRFSNNAPMKYTNWGSGEPNNEHGSAHNVELKTGINEATRLRHGFWNDLLGGWRGKGFICEWDE